MKSWREIYQAGKVVQGKPSADVISLVPRLKQMGATTILDHGCGTGRHIKYLVEQDFIVTGTDYSAEALSLAKQSLGQQENFALVNCGMGEIPVKNNSFDAIISIQTIQHGLKSERDQAFTEIKRTLKTGGLLLLRTISQKHLVYGKGTEVEPDTFHQIEELPDGNTPHHYFSEEEVKSYLKDFEIIEFKHRSSPPKAGEFFDQGLEEWVVIGRKVV